MTRPEGLGFLRFSQDRIRTAGLIARALTLALILFVLAARCSHADGVADGDRAFQAERLDDALRFYQAAARGGSAEAQAGIGRVWLARGRLDDAGAAFRRA